MSDEQTTALSSEQVITYLKNHPDFFKKHPEMITQFNFEHETEGAVSLIERQVRLLREHHQTTRQRLVELSNIAKTNEALLNRIRTLSIATAIENTPKAILDALTNVITEDFGLDSVYLIVEHKVWPMYSNNIISVTSKDLANLRNAVYNLSSFVGRPSEKIRQLAFKGNEDTTASIAMTRFKYKDTDSYMVIGSKDGNHFTNDMATDFVSYIGDFLQALLSR